VKLLREAADVTALKAISVAGLATKDLRLVPGVGLYRYDSGSSATETLPWIVAPTVGGGRWVHILANYAPVNRIVAATSVASVATRTTTSSTYGDISGAAISIPGLQ
jgi:hypothetical protein